MSKIELQIRFNSFASSIDFKYENKAELECLTCNEKSRRLNLLE